MNDVNEVKQHCKVKKKKKEWTKLLHDDVRHR